MDEKKEQPSDERFSHPAFSHSFTSLEPAAVLAGAQASWERYAANREAWMAMYGACEMCKVHPHRTLCGGCDEPEEDCDCAEN